MDKHDEAQARILKLYGAQAKLSGPGYPLAGHPDPSRWVVAVRATRPPRGAAGPLGASLTHELFGHAYLGQRGHIADHVGIIHRLPGPAPTKVPVNVTAPTAATLPPSPLGHRFSGIGARHNKVVETATGTHIATEEFGAPGFAELFAAIQTDADRSNVMPPTLGVVGDHLTIRRAG